MDTASLVAEFLSAKAAAGRSSKTIQGYRSLLGRFERACPVLPTDTGTLRDFLGSIPGVPETVDAYYRVLNTLYNWAETEPNPMLRVERPILRPKAPRILTIDQLQDLLTDGSHTGQVRVLLYFLSDTGARIGEAANLRRPYIDRAQVTLTGKTGERIVPMSEQVFKMVDDLPRHPEASEWVWWGRKGPLRAGTLGVRVKECL